MLLSQQENGKGDRDDNNPSDNQVDSRRDNLKSLINKGLREKYNLLKKE